MSSAGTIIGFKIKVRLLMDERNDMIVMDGIRLNNPQNADNEEKHWEEIERFPPDFIHLFHQGLLLSLKFRQYMGSDEEKFATKRISSYISTGIYYTFHSAMITYKKGWVARK
ncbi:hypothetical protein LOAG_01031 [Loa loa]|uniref:Uncharacterized protein n=1 Tax=Loa loa TaxID=7209 RepID=A0A1S0UAF8_LOALO|nr:hypothetical protein LOAG_01031 [Loa loa]EFO27460.1 hypothetical protein LOAG_01031 [Loa loa]